jgi:hypothetical protein
VLDLHQAGALPDAVHERFTLEAGKEREILQPLMLEGDDSLRPELCVALRIRGG